jgi:hypothetical protein
VRERAGGDCTKALRGKTGVDGMNGKNRPGASRGQRARQGRRSQPHRTEIGPVSTPPNAFCSQHINQSSSRRRAQAKRRNTTHWRGSPYPILVNRGGGCSKV